MPVICSRNLYCLVIMAVLCTAAAPPVVCASDATAAVVVSRKIRPYLLVTEGILAQVPEKISDTDVFFLSPGDDLVTAQVTDRLITGSYDLVAAVGPEAAALIWQAGIPGKKIYAALLDPDAVSRIPDDACGISLRIPVAVQVETIASIFPSLQKIGLLFDPEHNQWFFDAASAAAAASGLSISIVPLQVTERNQIAQVLATNLELVDAVWMIPDRTVISEKLIQYVIKQALYKETGVIGYNAYFVRTGAFFSFEFDYRALGRQAGTLITDSLTDRDCRSVPPVFESRSNPQIAEKLGLNMEASR
ncbi:MAG TPA: ABC transporter substrate binding protein [Desulfotignum sp.]|nr:ABC transporter substrate binding protein [Desulfotignum sp.]